ncbi:hypothetical protein AGMMS50239_13760 [Bacteroidia bacterium]|nr:hypothetical protein AGMMS50239_13760 [Bacteroidia bacterium]
MNNKDQLIRIGKKIKLHLIKRLKNYLYLQFKYGVFSGRLISFNDLDSETDILYSRKTALWYSPPFFVWEDPLGLLQGLEYIQYAVRLKNVALLGDSNLIVFPSGNVLYDLPFYDAENRYLYTDYKIIELKNRKVSYWKGRKRMIDKAVWMGGNYAWNYYHFLYEFVIKFGKLNELQIPTDVPVLVSQKCLDIPQFKELLDIVNEKGYPLIGVDRDEYYEVGELYFINCPNFIPPNNRDDNDGRPSDVQYDKDALDDLRRYLLPYASPKTFAKRVFLSRKTASGRRRFNEEELMRLCAEFGFEEVIADELSFREQISLFSQAEWIIGGSGAAFTNLLFCNIRNKIIILSKTKNPSVVFSTVATVVGADVRYFMEEVPGVKVRTNTLHDPFTINVANFRKYLIDNGIDKHI